MKLPDGRLFCVMRTSAGSPFWSVSSDTGETWTSPRRLLRKHGGEPLRHPVSPCPIYDVGGNEAGSGRYVLFIHDNDGNFKGYRPKPSVTGFNRRPIYLVTGRFQPGADQPVWFDELQFFMDHDNVSLGKPGTSSRFDLSLYSSFTVRHGAPVLWYPDRKFFLLGRRIGNEWFEAGGRDELPSIFPLPGSQQAAFGVENIKLGGVFGHRIETMIKGNLLKLDMEQTFLSYFRNKRETAGYRGLGKTLDAAVHSAAYTRDETLIRWKDHWIGELISTQEADGYIGIFPSGSLRAVAPYDTHEKGPIILALVNDYHFFGRAKSLEAARKLADEMIATWSASVPDNYLYTDEDPMILLSEVSGDRRYLNWVRDTFFPKGQLMGAWTMRLGGDPREPLKMEGCHTYRWCDVNLAMLNLNRHQPDPILVAAWPQMIAWLKDGGALPPGSFAESERWRRSWTTRSGIAPNPEFLWKNPNRTCIGESCAKCYVLELLDRLMEVAPDAYFGDVMERAYYNGVFASQSPDGRRLAYDLSVEGTRIPNPADHYCCPGNLRRAFAYLPGRMYRQLADGLYVNLYGESQAVLPLLGGAKMELRQVTDYPVSGKIRIEINPGSPVKLALAFRIPAWCDAPSAKLNGKAENGIMRPGTFLRLDREWRAGDVVELDFPMEWRWVRGIREQDGRASLLRGPVVFTLNPFDSGMDWFQDMGVEGMGISRVTNPKTNIPNYGEHLESMRRLDGITLAPSTLSAPMPDQSVHPYGQQATVKGWLGAPTGKPDHTFALREFVDPRGRKIFFQMSDHSKAVDDELFGKEVHEKTVYPARWPAEKKGLDATAMAQVPDTGLAQAVLVKPMRGSYEAETAQGELAGRPAWMSASLAKTGKRRMEFRVHDPKFEDGATPEVTLSVLYLDKGNCKVSLIYDSGDDVVRVRGRAPGAFKPGGEFQIGNTGTIKRHDFQLPDARFGKNLLLEGTDFRLVANKDVDFVILGAFLQPDAVAAGNPAPNNQPAVHLKDCTDPARLTVAGRENASLRQARKNAFGVEEIQLSGIMGQRMMFTLDSIHMMNNDAIFAAPWRDRSPKKNEKFNGVGHMLEGLVLLAAYTGNPRDVALKDQLIDSILATQEADGYVGRFAPGERGRQQKNHDTEDQVHFLRAVTIDSKVFGWKPERRTTTERMARWVMDTWEDAGKQSVSGFDECFMALYGATGDRGYLDFPLKVSFPSNTFSSFNWGWQWWTGYDPATDSFDLRNVHVYRGTAIAKAQLEINEVRPHPLLTRMAPEIVGWLKDGGATLPGSSSCWEAFTKSQFGRSGRFNPTIEYWCMSRLHKVGEACSHVYLGQFLETDFDRRAPDCWHYDVIERNLYNAIFAAQSKEARPEWNGAKQRYDMPFEGPRAWFNSPTYCCPNNFRKYIGQLPRLMYKIRNDGIYVNLYEASRAVVDSGNGPITVTQETSYPRDGKILFRIDPGRGTEAAFHFRIPAWCARPALKVNGKTVENVKPDSYAAVTRIWKQGDVVELALPTEWRWIAGFRDQEGRAGLMRGPLVFTLNPVLNRLPGYQDLTWEPADYMQALKFPLGAKEYAEYQPSYDLLQDLVIDPGSLSAPIVDPTVYGNGIAAKVKAWSRPEKASGQPDLTLTLTEFSDEGGRKVFFRLRDATVAQPDPLFARELKEATVFPKKWDAAKAGLDTKELAKLPFTPSAQDLLVPALRSSGDEMSAPGELAGHQARLSVSELNRPYRKMGFRMPDDRFLARTPGRVQVTIVYLDRGDCDVQVFYDSSDKSWEVLKTEHAAVFLERVKQIVKASKGAFKPATVIKVGSSRRWRFATFELQDARFATESDGKDIFLYINKNEDFIVQGVYVRELERGNEVRSEGVDTMKNPKVELRD